MIDSAVIRSLSFRKALACVIVSALISLVTACGGGGSSSENDDLGSQKVEANIGATGGTVNWISTDNSIRATLTVPNGALNSDTTLTAQATTATASDISFIAGTVIDFGPDGLVFSSPAQLVIEYDPTKLGEIVESAIAIYHFSNNSWSVLSSSLDVSTHTITAQISGFSTFAAGVELTPPHTTATPVGGTYTSGTALSVTLDCDDGNGSGCVTTHYTLDNAEPDTNSPVYDHPISIDTDTTLKYFSVDLAENNEAVRTETYVFTTQTLYSVGGTVSGLNGTVVIENTNGDSQSIANDGAFQFFTKLVSGTDYAVTVKTQPIGQNCTITKASGIISDADITDVNVTCVDNPTFYALGGNISGLAGTVELNNGAGETKSFSQNGSFSFDSSLAEGANYQGSVQIAPNGQTCSVSNASGTISGADIGNIGVSCVDNPTFYSVGGTISGLTGTVELSNGAGETKSFSQNGSFSFDSSLADGASYQVSVQIEPNGQTCTVANASGTISGADIGNIGVTCVDNPTFYSIGGTISGLTGTVELSNGAGETKSFSQNGSFSFDSSMANGASYQVSVQIQPANQICSVSNATGTVTADITNISVSCGSATGWVHPQLNEFINTLGRAANPTMAMNKQGDAIVAWNMADENDSTCSKTGDQPCLHIFVKMYQNGSWIAVPDTTHSISPNNFHASSFKVAISDNGDAIVVWQMNTSWSELCGNVLYSCSRIFMSELRNGTWTHPASINDYIDPPNFDNVSHLPQVAMNSHGDTIIVWRNFSGGIYKSVYHNVWAHPQSINDYIPGSLAGWNPHVAMNDNSHIIIAWQGYDSSYHNRIYLSEYRGTWQHAKNLDNDAINPPGQACPGISCPIPIKIAMDNSNNAIIVWDQHTTGYAQYDDGRIYKSEYRDGAWTHPADINDTVSPGVETDGARYPEVAMDNNGNALIVWRQNDETEDCDVVPPGMYRSFPGPCLQMFMSERRDGSWTKPVSMSDHISITGQAVDSFSALQSYAVAMSDNGSSLIAWTQEIPAESCTIGLNKKIYVSQYLNGGWNHPATFEDNLVPLDIDNYTPIVKMDTNGNILLGWDSLGDLYFSKYNCTNCSPAPEIIAPRNLKAIAGDAIVNLSWHEVSNAHSYNIYWSDTGTATTQSNKISSVTGNSYSHTDLTNKNKYSYLVTAVVSSIESLPSDDATAQPSACIGCEPILSSTTLIGTDQTDSATAVTVDNNDNVIVAGYTASSLQGTVNGVDPFITKYNAAGEVQWLTQINESGYQYAYGVATDNAGNIYLTGRGFVLTKLNTAGVVDSNWTVPASSLTVGYGIAIDKDGNVYITGETKEDLDPDNEAMGDFDIFISKYNAVGVHQWTRQPSTDKADSGKAIAVDAEGNVYVTGMTKGALGTEYPDGNEDLFVTKYDTNGSHVWTRQVDPTPISGPFQEVGTGIALDSKGNIYVSGWSNGAIFDDGLKGYINMFLFKYSNDGCLDWTRLRGASQALNDAQGISIDANDNVYVTGYTTGALDGNTHSGIANDRDTYVMKFKANGSWQWTKQYGTSGGIDNGNAIATNSKGDIFTVGETDGDLNGETNGGSSAWIFDAFIMKHEAQE